MQPQAAKPAPAAITNPEMVLCYWLPRSAQCRKKQSCETIGPGLYQDLQFNIQVEYSQNPVS